MSETSSPWLTLGEAAAYARRGRRFLRNEVKAARLRAAVCGARRELLFRREWIDAWIEDHATPVVVSSGRRFAG
jgi:hypothetical protein